MRKLLLCLFAFFVLAGCRDTPTDIALGTIEWDRVELVATAAEPVTAIAVREGDPVAPDDLVLEQRADRTEAELAAAAAELERVRQVLAEQQAGARPEQKREVAARVERARAALKLDEAKQSRGLGLKTRGLISTAELDRLGATAEVARSELMADGLAGSHAWHLPRLGRHPAFAATGWPDGGDGYDADGQDAGCQARQTHGLGR